AQLAHALSHPVLHKAVAAEGGRKRWAEAGKHAHDHGLGLAILSVAPCGPVPRAGQALGLLVGRPGAAQGGSAPRALDQRRPQIPAASVDQPGAGCFGPGRQSRLHLEEAMTAPRIHVLLPVHNRKVTTEKFVRCLKAQAGADWHLVLIDDGSADGTAEM